MELSIAKPLLQNRRREEVYTESGSPRGMTDSNGSEADWVLYERGGLTALPIFWLNIGHIKHYFLRPSRRNMAVKKKWRWGQVV